MYRLRWWMYAALGLVLLAGVVSLAEETAWAGEENGYVLFQDDFESSVIGNPPNVSASNPDYWTASASSPESPLTVVEDEGSQVLQYERVSTATGHGGPRVDKRLEVHEEGTVTVQFRLKTQGYQFYLDLRRNDNTEPAATRMLHVNGAGLISEPPPGVSFSGNDYVDATVVIDFANHTYTTLLNGEPIHVDVSLNAGLDPSELLVFRFSAVLNPGQILYMDDVLITTDRLPGPEADPEYMLFEDDFENSTVGNPPNVSASNPDYWTASASSAESTLTIVVDGGSQVLKYERVSTATGGGGPRVDKRLDVHEESTATVQFRIKTQGYRFDLDLRRNDNTEPATTRLLALNGAGLVPSPPAGVSGSSYVDAKVMIDFDNHTYSSWLNGEPIQTGVSLNAGLDAGEPLVFRFSTSLQPGQILYLDDVQITTNRLPSSWEGESIVEQLIPAHPRLMATADDFAALQIQVQTDPVSINWYNQLVNSADNMLNQPVSIYEFWPWSISSAATPSTPNGCGRSLKPLRASRTGTRSASSARRR